MVNFQFIILSAHMKQVQNEPLISLPSPQVEARRKWPHGKGKFNEHIREGEKKARPGSRNLHSIASKPNVFFYICRFLHAELAPFYYQLLTLITHTVAIMTFFPWIITPYSSQHMQMADLSFTLRRKRKRDDLIGEVIIGIHKDHSTGCFFNNKKQKQTCIQIYGEIKVA